MKIFSAFSLLLLLVFLSEMGTAAMGGRRKAHAVRIPEHTCGKVAKVKRKCYAEKCRRKCLKYPFGFGRCLDSNTCFCTFYCKYPPQ